MFIRYRQKIAWYYLSYYESGAIGSGLLLLAHSGITLHAIPLVRSYYLPQKDTGNHGIEVMSVLGLPENSIEVHELLVCVILNAQRGFFA